MACFVTASQEFARLSSQTLRLNARSFSKSAVHAKQTYPLYPSVAQLLHEKGVPLSEADKIPASGPKGRLLKGDVLAYLGTISSSYSSDQSARISKLGHLNLSNIKIAPPKESPTPAKAARAPPAAEHDTEVAVSISLKAVLEVQKRIQNSLDITLPLSTFIARAAEVANDDLPRSSSDQPTANELFYQVLGLDKVNSKTSRGNFTPQILALPPKPLSSTAGPAKKADIIDILTAKRSGVPSTSLGVPTPGILAGLDAGSVTNVFRVSAPKGEEKRARVFLERVKTILQVEPGRLVL